MPQITLLPSRKILEAVPGQTLHSLLASHGLIHAPCGGQGTCGKCAVMRDGREVLACQTPVDRDMTVTLPEQTPQEKPTQARGSAAAFDIGTTTLVCYLLGSQGDVLCQASCRNPQAGFGGDVISRIRAAQAGHQAVLTAQLRAAMADLLSRVCEAPEEIHTVCVVGNPAMQQLFLGLPVDNLARLPFAPVLTRGQGLPCGDCLPICPKARLLVVPDISGFVGADTVAGVLATGLHQAREMTLLVDIGTNGEMVLGDCRRMVACSTAAGPALEGAGIQFGMGAEPGAIDHVYLEAGRLQCSVIGGGEARGICGSGLIDAIAAAMDLGLVDPRGKLLTEEKYIPLADGVRLTQEDIRQVQLAKGAICAGIQRMAGYMGISLEAIRHVVLAGAFGSYLDPEKACRIGMIPSVLMKKITAAGNTAGAGAVRIAASPGLLAAADEIAGKTELLELAGLPEFPRSFARAMLLPEDWQAAARAIGFTHAAAFHPEILQAREDVRAMCAQDTCRAYGKNWTCPPHCGTLEACQANMRGYRHGVLVQTVGRLAKTIDSRGYRETERRHLESFAVLCQAVRRAYPSALCLGAGGCRVCKRCAFPEPCRFPEQAISSMEGYGLFVTQVCRDAGLDYYHGEKTITYTACILYG